MTAGAVYTFLEFAASSEIHLTIPGEGTPCRAARSLRRALQPGRPPAGLLESFLRSERHVRVIARPEDTHPADHRYVIRLHPRRCRPLVIEAWRRHGAMGMPWQRRCGPMPLESFVERFSPLSGPSRPHAVAPGHRRPGTPACDAR